jgi:DNA-binding XRE family transcriptional regulator
VIGRAISRDAARAGATTVTSAGPGRRSRPRVRINVDAEGRSLGDRVAARRRSLGLSRGGLAELAGLYWRTIRDVETETHGLHAYTLAALADALETTMDALWHGEGERSV